MNTGQPSTAHNNCKVICNIEEELSCMMDQFSKLSVPLAQLESTVGDLTRGSEEKMGPIKATAHVINQEPKRAKTGSLTH